MGNRFKCSLAHGGSGGAEGNTLIVTCDPDFAGVTISASKSGTTYTQTCPSSSPYTVTFHGLDAGTWDISATVSGDTYSTSVTITDFTASLSYGFNWATWVTLGGLDPTDYSNLSDVFADEAAVRRLMLIHASADYLIDAVTGNVDVIDNFCSNDIAMKWIGLCDYVCDGLTAITGVETKLLASTYWERYLKDHVPTMTGNTAPYGTASATNNNTGAYKAFNGTNESGTSDAYEGSGLNIRLEYEFPTPICVKKILVANRNNSTVYAIENFKLQGSNDGTTWTDIDSFTKADGVANEETFSAASNTTYFKKLGIYITSTYDTSSTHYSRVGKLQFYGRSLNVSVPVMTSNNAPFGALSGNAISGTPLYMAFDADKTNYAAISDGGKCVYDFLSRYVIKAIEVYSNSSNNYYAKAVQLIGSDDNANFDDIGESQTLNNAAHSVFIYYPNNKTSYRYSGISITSNSTGNQSVFKIINFYGLDYSEKEFEAGSTKKWIYDHGVELETITAYEQTASDHVTKNSDDIYLESVANGAAEIHTDSFDLTPYNLLRIRIGDVISSSNSGATTYGSYGVADSTPAVTGASYIGKVDVAANSLPNNSGLDISSFDVTKPIAYYQASGSYTYKCKITELWLLS